ncbi:MAG: hypothetical protein B7X04_01870 [Parcubacteria group bacterium 21-54-25]|nr:MAG: hypothetical protein B7X04_01870 [Parcubacteria group bacterium 21-54-25]HQU07678.1 metalloregulator ArsR/SmtB family transcription factor [Candidatus Paceibacterota bacterium]
MRKRSLKKELQNEKEVQKCAEEFRVVGDPTRLKICYLLCRHSELSVGEIASAVGVSVSAVSHTLTKLKQAGLVEDRRDFRHVYYRFGSSPFSDLLRKRMQSSL